MIISKKKILSKLEDLIYSNNDKLKQDKLFKLYLNLFNQVDFTNYKVMLKENPIKLIIKHKAFNNKVCLYYNDDQLYLENKKVDLHDVNELLPTFFIISLDKKEK